MIKLFAVDIDGVLTDGRVFIDEDGSSMKCIHFRDLDALGEIQGRGVEVILVTGEAGALVDRIGSMTGAARVYPRSKDKLSALKEAAAEFAVALDEIAYIGDASRDASALAAVGLGLAPADADPRAKKAAGRVLECGGGQGAVSEAVRLITKTLRDA